MLDKIQKIEQVLQNKIDQTQEIVNQSIINMLHSLVELKVYADAAHAVNDNMASQTGNCISLGVWYTSR